MLLYPGGQYMRAVSPLLQPGESPRDMGPIVLHMPVRHRASPSRTAAAEAATAAEPATTPKTPRRTQVAKAAPPTAPAEATTLPGYTSFGAASTPAPAPTPAPKPAPVAKAQAPAKPPVQVAKAEPPPATTSSALPEEAAPPTAGLTKRSMISFAPNQTDPAKTALGPIKFLAGALTTDMTSPSSRIELYAYGGPRGDKSSDSHRLSLKRALAIRQVLIDDGVPPDRIDVHAPGGADDSGPADRVDVFIKA